MSDPDVEIARLRAELLASEARAAVAEAELATARAVLSTSEAMILHLKLEIAKLRRAQYGRSSEHRARLIEQMELQLEELEATATEDEIAAERVTARTATVAAFERRRPVRKPFPGHLPRERVVIEAPKHNPVAKAINYVSEKSGRWEAFIRFLDDGRICLTNNAAERALRGIALGRKVWLFAGSERGGNRAAFMYTLIVTAKLNDIDPQVWLADVLARMSNMPVSRLPELLPWNWAAEQNRQRDAA